MPPDADTLRPRTGRTGRSLALALLACASIWPAALLAQDACDGVAPAPVLKQVNAARAKGLRCGGDGPVQPSNALAWSPLLARAAQQQADWLARHGLLVHTGPRGESLPTRVAAAGYRHARVGENLAAGQDGVVGALRAWEASASHCRTLVDPRFTETALACATGLDGEPFWVLLLGRPL